MKVQFLLGSKVDMDFAQKIADNFGEWGIDTDIRVASAHKVPEKVFQIVSDGNKEEDLVYVTIAGRSNGLSGVTAANSVHPVIACPPFKDKDDMMVNINSTLMMPSDTPVLTVVDPQNCVMSILRIFALKNPELKDKIRIHIEKIKADFE